MSGGGKVPLRGSSWDHPRGHDPMVATAQRFAHAFPWAPAIEWTPRSLLAFGVQPIDELAERYDLIVLDHPHVGDAARADCLVPLEEVLTAGELDALSGHAIGHSHESYAWGGHQWALAIDAAAQVSAWHAGVAGAPPGSWDEVVALARDGAVLWPLKAVDVYASFATLAANLGAPCCADRDRFVEREAGHEVLEAIAQVATHLDTACRALDPVLALDRLASELDGREPEFYCPLTFGYTNYAREGFRAHRLVFGDIPTLGSEGPRGSLLGGAGIAISRSCRDLDAAARYAGWVAGPQVQRTLYVAAGGQPAHLAAWDDPEADRLSGGFLSGVRMTLDGAWTRPRYPGFPPFQRYAMESLHRWLMGELDARTVLDELDHAYRASGPVLDAGADDRTRRVRW